ncbi:MAG: GDSL-type esterase/lipase family protein [Planctomycetota bacterium]|jgi:hypothetical protein
MALGDSITVGFGFAGGYRSFLQFELDKLPKPFEFVGSSQVNPPPAIYDPDHEGHAGFRVRDLIAFAGDENNPASTIEGWLTDAQPGAICLHIGTNDTGDPSDWHEADEDLDELLDRIWAFDPETWLVLAELIPTGDPSRNLLIEHYNRRVRELFVERLFAGDRIRWVDLYPLGFSSGDGSLLHPDATIYSGMGLAFYDGVRQVGLPPILPEMDAPALGLGLASASDASLGFEAFQAFDVLDVVDELHDSEAGGAWVSAAFDTEGLAGEPLTPVGAGPSIEFELDQLADVAWIDLYSGRRDPAALPGSWVHVDQVLRWKVQTSPDGATWFDQADLLARPVPEARLQPGERFQVDWSAVRHVRLEVLELQESAAVDGLQGPRLAALSEARFGGTPISLGAVPQTLSISAAEVQFMPLDAGPERAGQTFFMLGSGVGTSPGVPLSAGVLPLVPDAYTFLTATLGATPPLSAGLAQLDGQGRALVTLTTSPTWPPDLIGATVYHAYVTLDLNAPVLDVTFVSNAASVRLLP